MKKILSLLLSVVLIVAMIPLSATTVSAVTYSGTCGDNIIYNLDSDTGILTISGDGRMTDYLTYYVPWGNYKGLIKTIIFDGSITHIGDCAFYGCYNLTEVIIPNSITSIGELAFSACNKLTEITVQEGNSVYHSDGNCIIRTADKTLVFGFENSVIPTDGSVISIGDNAFRNCSLTDLSIPDNITSIGYSAFYECTNLTGIIIPYSVKNIGDFAFSKCTHLETITVDKNNSKYKSTSNCLIEIDTNTLILGCKNSIIPTDGSVTSIGYSAFYGCTGLTSVNIPNSVISIGNFAFQYCTNLTEVIIPNSVINIIGDSFYNCNSKIIFMVENPSVAYDYAKENGYNYYLTYITAPNVPTIECKTETSVTINHIDGHEYSLDGENWQSSNVFNELSVGTTYSFYQRVAKTDNSVASEISEPLIISSPSVPGKPVVASKTNTSVTLVAVDGYEYKVNNGEWQSSPVFEGLSENTTYSFYQRVAATNTTFPSPISAKTDIATYYEITITYDLNGGTGNSSLVVYNGVETVLSDTPIMSGHKFMGWSLSKYGEVVYPISSSISLDSNITLYAVWMRSCSNCAGDGHISSSHTCGKCGGTGYDYISCYSCNGTGASSYTTDCPACTGGHIIVGNSAIRCTSCNGTGSLSMLKDCSTCDGSGKVTNVPGGCSTCLGHGIIYSYSTCNLCEGEGTFKINITDNIPIPKYIEVTENKIILKQLPDFEYSLDGLNWQDSNVFNNLVSGHNYNIYQRIKETSTHYASESSLNLSVTTDKPTPSKPSAPVLSNKTDTTVTLIAKSGYEYKIDNGTWQSSNVFSGLSPNKTYSFYQRIAATNTAYASGSSNALTVTTNKSTVAKPSAPTLSSKTETIVTLTAKSGYEYSKNGTTWQSSNVFTGLNSGTQYTFYQRIAETDTTYASEKSNALTVTTVSSVPSTTTSTIHTVSGNTISKITAGTTVNSLLSGLSAGQYCKVYKGDSEVAGTSKVGTGMVVKIMDGNTVKTSYTVIVTGDTNGDGDITITDMLAIKAHVLKKSTLSGAYATAADTSGDGGVTITDFIQVKAKILGKGNIVER